MIYLEDNTPCDLSFSPEKEGLRLIANQTVESLQRKHPELLVFPQCLDDCKDDLKKQSIFSLSEDIDSLGERTLHVMPTNLVGYIGVNGTNISITSRFSPGTGLERDFFLQYLLQKALDVNIFNLRHSYSTDEDIFDFLMLLFPGMLKQALAQGLYKEYQTQARNDANVKGCIDIPRHLQVNIPFNGKVAYRSREISYDNSVTELIRHTIEFINTRPLGRMLLNGDSETIGFVNQIVLATPAYSKNSRNQVVRNNSKPVSHPYFTKYKPLQNLCLRILRHEKIHYSEAENSVYGILFDMSWLWEEYLAKLLPGFNHPRNREGTGAIYLGERGAMERYPDYYKDETGGIVLDAKYKREVKRDDQHQVISYMYRLRSRYGGFLMPTKGANSNHKTKLLGYGERLGYHSLAIPQESTDFSSFCKSIVLNEALFVSEIGSL